MILTNRTFVAVHTGLNLYLCSNYLLRLTKTRFYTDNRAKFYPLSPTSVKSAIFVNDENCVI